MKKIEGRNELYPGYKISIKEENIMHITKEPNGLWKCKFKDITFYVEDMKEAIAIVWEMKRAC